MEQSPFPTQARRSGFTLVDLLCVMGMMLVLLALLRPAISGAWQAASRDRMAADLQVICSALEAYHGDWQQYPPVYFQAPTRVTNTLGQSVVQPGGGAYWLCRALAGPGDYPTDGAGVGNPNNSAESGLGWRDKAGKIRGPYLPADTIKMGDPTGADNVNNYVFLDRKGHPILYYAGRQGSNIYQGQGYLGPQGMFDPNDNALSTASYDKTTGPMTREMFMILMGDLEYDGKIEGFERPAFLGNYVLWSAGPDEKFGPPDGSKPPSPSNPCDDLANFQRSPY